ncbi:PREDICTED: uncharacterized protein LOC104817136 [Tarenaya hassleriana]|uniref:uncharacterized protein LOC104817136 n=1 Tax=Tarenaya hassleriana TaxID=28532 RepID=UPI00053C4A96|nr:PREDICTED: uncharacterized protein LOC104817136 [Tarenaya hassleriana]
MTINLFMINRTASFILVLVMILNTIGASAGKSGFPDPREIQLRLKQLNKPALKSIESPDGDIIDCVSITEQPAFDDPLLRDHTIQMRPSFDIEDLSTSDAFGNGTNSDSISQLWRTNGECPENTVPIRRTTKEDLLRDEKYGKKYQNKTSNPNFSNHRIRDPKEHEYAVAFATKGWYNGAKARMNVWKPWVQYANEFSLSQIWVTSGVHDIDLNTLEAGWQVYKRLYKDNNPRLFAYWTRDSYGETGCYNHVCPGFVQTSRTIALGASIRPISAFGGAQYGITLIIKKDQTTGNWWLGYQGTMVGYWPGSIVPNLANGATGITWGGEILNKRMNGKHTTTDMGSGRFPYERFREASYFRNLGVFDMENVLRDPGTLKPGTTNPHCYDVKISSSKSWGTYFYYGGPGLNSRCP